MFKICFNSRKFGSSKHVTKELPVVMHVHAHTKNTQYRHTHAHQSSCSMANLALEVKQVKSIFCQSCYP